MDILDELAEKFAINLDSTLVSNPEYNKVSLQLQELYEKSFQKNRHQNWMHLSENFHR